MAWFLEGRSDHSPPRLTNFFRRAASAAPDGEEAVWPEAG